MMGFERSLVWKVIGLEDDGFWKVMGFGRSWVLEGHGLEGHGHFIKTSTHFNHK